MSSIDERVRHEHTFIKETGLQEDGEGGHFMLYTCTHHPVRYLPKIYPCFSTMCGYVYGGIGEKPTIDMADYEFLGVFEGVKHYYFIGKENKNPSRVMAQ